MVRLISVLLMFAAFAIAVDPKYAEAYVLYASYYSENDNWPAAAEKANLSIDLGRAIEPEFLKEFKQHGIELHNCK